jgi:archaellum component FlaC
MINDKFKFIYTKISKTGSTSVENTLEKLSGRKYNTGHYHILDDINENTQKYFKFTFFRNPWDRCVSRFHYTRTKYNVNDGLNREMYKAKSFSDFIRSESQFSLSTKWCRHSPNLQKIMQYLDPFENQIDWISNEDGHVLTDFIGRVETMQNDFNTICDKIGIPRQELPHKNKSKHKHYTEYYDNETRKIVAEKYAKDIEYFGYKFGE